ncbi:MAG: DUF2382 domain-containing protein [Actinomycetes bacterium]
MPITSDQLRTLAGAGGNVVSTSGDKIGSIGQIYLDDNTGEPTWVTVKTGLFGTSESFVPLQGADSRGDDIVVSYDKATVKDAPRVDDDGSISPEEEDRLYAYYGLGGADYATTTTDTDYDSGADRGADYVATSGVTDDYDRGADGGADGGAVGHDTSGPTTDDAMTRSEERLRVGTQKRETGRARLRKYVVTENVTETVPVSREEVRIEREPITDANIGDATSGPDISEEEHEVILHEERPVVQKETVPVERVRLDTETVTDEATVSEEIRKEQIDTDVDGDDRRLGR